MSEIAKFVNQVLQGDCISLLKKIPEQTIDMVFADPPYNLSGKGLSLKGNTTGGDWHKVNERWDTYSFEDYEAFTGEWIGESVRTLKPSGAIYVCASQHNLETVLAALRRAGCSVNNIIVWQKSNPMPNTTKRLLTHSVEFVVWAVKGKGWTFNASELREINPDTQRDGSPRMMRDVWTLPVLQGPERIRGKDGRALHPTQKPLELVRRTIIASTNAGELVLDPFLGTGTTAVSALTEGRRFIGFEKEKDYVSVAKKRLKPLLA